MKYILRYTILNFYTVEQQNKISQSQLLSTLQLANFANIQQCDVLVNRCRDCIDQLIRDLGKQSQEQTAATIQSYFQQLTNGAGGTVSELVKTWQNQRHSVLGQILFHHTQSCARFSNVNWQINNRISSKNQSDQHMSVNLTFTLQTQSSQTNKTSIQMDKHKVNQLQQVLSSAAEFLSHNLK